MFKNTALAAMNGITLDSFKNLKWDLEYEKKLLTDSVPLLE